MPSSRSAGDDCLPDVGRVSAAERLSAFGARTGIILGSGLASFADRLDIAFSIPHREIDGFPSPAVSGHDGHFLAARWRTHKVLVCVGRVHLYEGWSASDVVRGVEIMHAAGVSSLVLTNAAGAVNPGVPPGGWLLVSDHLNLTGHSPLRGSAHFADMSAVYSPRLRAAFSAAAKTLELRLPEGIYAAMPGPQYETPAEIRMLRVLGADVVGMSTVLEAIKAHSLGMEVAALSAITNWAAGLSDKPLCHDDVLIGGRSSVEAFARLFELALHEIDGG